MRTREDPIIFLLVKKDKFGPDIKTGLYLNGYRGGLRYSLYEYFLKEHSSSETEQKGKHEEN